MGSSTAYHLAKIRNGDGRGIVVLERDPTYARASAMLSAGGIRQQFSLKENVEMSLYGRDFLRNANTLLRKKNDDDEIDVQFHEHGYLFLASTEDGVKQMKENHAVQCAAGCKDIKLMQPLELRLKFPWLNSRDILMGSFGEKGEGWFDPWALVKAWKDKNVDMGVTYLHGQPLSCERDHSSGRIISSIVQDFRLNQSVKYNVDYVINAAGACAGQVMTLLAGPDRPLCEPLPVKPRKRCIFFFHCSAKKGVPHIAPLTVDPSLVYFRSEGSGGKAQFLCGVSPRPEHDVDCHDEKELQNVDPNLFQEVIWPLLYHRVPAFGEIKVKSSWAGLYEYNTVDREFHGCFKCK